MSECLDALCKHVAVLTHDAGLTHEPNALGLRQLHVGFRGEECRQLPEAFAKLVTFGNNTLLVRGKSYYAHANSFVVEKMCRAFTAALPGEGFDAR